jgi:hypothetical protein
VGVVVLCITAIGLVALVGSTPKPHVDMDDSTLNSYAEAVCHGGPPPSPPPGFQFNTIAVDCNTA